VALDRFWDAIRELVRSSVPVVDYFAAYPATVLICHGDNTMDVRPDSARLADLTDVPLRGFVPGALVKVRKGARVLLAFDEGDRAKPFVRPDWDTGALEFLAITTGLGQRFTLDDDRDAGHANPIVRLENHEGDALEFLATPKIARFRGRDGGKLEIDEDAKTLTLEAGGERIVLDRTAKTISISSENGVTINSSAGNIVINAQGHVLLGTSSGGMPVARVGDAVVNGVIVSGSSKVKA
jgi:hypothetical protein